jgi:hypothetical protein
LVVLASPSLSSWMWIDGLVPAPPESTTVGGRTSSSKVISTSGAA